MWGLVVECSPEMGPVDWGVKIPADREKLARTAIAETGLSASRH